VAKPKIAIIISSVRPTRFADKPAQWILGLAKERPDLDVEIVDLKDYDLPLFASPASDAWVPATDPEVLRWQSKVAEFDGYIFVVAEYNRSITGALKNAIDQAYKAWNRKAAGFVGYGSVGGARAIEHLRNIAVELQLVPVRSGVHIGGSEFVATAIQGKPFEEITAVLAPSAKDMLDQLTWWVNATKTAREAEEAEQAAA
jgi:NAD(P)H-dependent FMN reductase